MSYSKLIHEYLDGDLNESQKEALFTELAGSEEIRSEFDKQVNLHTITRTDMSTITPPMETTNSLFAALGFSIPSERYINQLSGSKGGNGIAYTMKRFWGWYLSVITAAIVASSLTAVLFIFNGGSIFDSDEVASVRSGSSGNANIPVMSSIENDDENTQEAESSDVLAQSSGSESGNNQSSFAAFSNRNSGNSGNTGNASGVNSSGSGSDGTIAANANNSAQNDRTDRAGIANAQLDDYIAMNGRSSGAYNASSNSDIRNTGVADIPNISGNMTTLYIPLSNNIDISQFGDMPDQTKWTVEFRRISNIEYDNYGFTGEESQKINNYYLAVMYKPHHKHAVGLEIGRQPFPMKYEWNQKGKPTIEVINPSFFWAGLSYRFSANELTPFPNIAYPFAKVYTGWASTVGPMLGGETGLIVRFHNNFGLTFALEGNALYYRVGDEILVSDKLGYSIGFNYNFDL